MPPPRMLPDTTPAGLRAAVAAALPSVRALYVLFMADNDPASGGESWCGDCRRALPAVAAALAAAPEGSATLLRCNVGPKAAWKDAAHPLRTDPELKIGGVPTLLRWGPAGPGQRLTSEIESEPDAAAVQRTVAAFFAAGETSAKA